MRQDWGGDDRREMIERAAHRETRGERRLQRILAWAIIIEVAFLVKACASLM